MFNFKCTHKSSGYEGGVPYVYMDGSETDGIGRIHADLFATCDKCSKRFLLCRLHVDSVIRQLLSHPITKEEVLNIVKAAG